MSVTVVTKCCWSLTRLNLQSSAYFYTLKGYLAVNWHDTNVDLPDRIQKWMLSHSFLQGRSLPLSSAGLCAGQAGAIWLNYTSLAFSSFLLRQGLRLVLNMQILLPHLWTAGTLKGPLFLLPHKIHLRGVVRQNYEPSAENRKDLRSSMWT